MTRFTSIRIHTAAKCNFCAHRVDAGLKPSCEIVCPTQAIISEDLDDPDSEVRRLLDTEAATGELRRPIWLFRAVKPVLDAYKLPDDERTAEARAVASGSAPSAFDLAERVDWSPAETWGALYSDGLSRRSESSSSS